MWAERCGRSLGSVFVRLAGIFQGVILIEPRLYWVMGVAMYRKIESILVLFPFLCGLLGDHGEHSLGLCGLPSDLI